jgi:ATP/maltotriose-dependent transcriptional regulator MalT/DNA-binding SARP family transcriptional activator
MSGSFRFSPPEPHANLLSRPRLLRSLAGRWDHRVTSLVGGPGLGKTTLLSQAIAENRLSPRGDDIWLGLEPSDADADRLARVVATAITSDGDGHSGGGDPPRDDDAPPEPADVASTIWQRAPTEACLVLDDVHLVPPRSTGARWLKDLVDALPANGHLVLASRADPPIPLSRYGAQGAVLHLAEDQLRFTDDEVCGFAAARGVDVAHLGDLGGWPAMAELTATVGKRVTGDYLWEEVLEPLGTVRRHVLAVVCDLDGADDALASAAVGRPVILAEVFDQVPLVAQGATGWYRPHGLWRRAPALELSPTERAEVRCRAVEHLADRGRFDRAFALVEEIGLWDAAPRLLRAAALATDRVASTQLQRWLSKSPAPVRASAAGQLVAGMHRAFTEPGDAVGVLDEAVRRCQAEGDIDGEMRAIAQLGRLAWWQQDAAALVPLTQRVGELAATGHPAAAALARVARAIYADVAGDDAGVIRELGAIEPSVLDPAWEVLVAFLYCMVTLDLGETGPVHEAVDRLYPESDVTMRALLDSMRLRAWWHEGRVDDYTQRFTTSVTEVMQRSGVAYQHIYSLAIGSITSSYAGCLDEARRGLDEATARMAATSSQALAPYLHVAAAALALGDGDEERAAAELRAAFDVTHWEKGPERRLWRRFMALTYVLLPETRALWDDLDLRGFLATERTLARVVVALRTEGGERAVRRLGPLDVGVVRAALHHRFAVELAVGLAETGRPESRALLDALGDAGRAALRDLVSCGRHPHVRAAKTLLAAVPAPPRRPSYLAVLGPQVLTRDGPSGDEVLDADLRRRRVQELLSFLVAHRRTTRAAIADALWPELDERAAANNFGVTLNHLVRLLEPTRQAGEPPYLVRHEGQVVQLVTGEHLRIDVDDFERHLDHASQAEADGTPSVALRHYLDALDLYRDELFCELPDADWLVLGREHCRSRFVAAAIRTGQLLLASGDAAAAEDAAQKALDADPWSEAAYAVLVGAALARGDRTSAHRLLSRCLHVLGELGLEPADTTEQLRRRVESSG